MNFPASCSWDADEMFTFISPGLTRYIVYYRRLYITSVSMMILSVYTSWLIWFPFVCSRFSLTLLGISMKTQTAWEQTMKNAFSRTPSLTQAMVSGLANHHPLRMITILLVPVMMTRMLWLLILIWLCNWLIFLYFAYWSEFVFLYFITH